MRAGSRCSSAEGFVRQVIGWRDYVWNVYWHFGAGLPAPERALGRAAAAASGSPTLDADAVAGALPVRRAAGRARPRLGAPHPAADGAGELRPAARLGPARAHRLVPPLLRRRLRLGDGRRTSSGMSQHADGGLMATKPYASGGRVHQPDERLLPPVRLPAHRAARARTRAPSPPATGRSSTATASGCAGQPADGPAAARARPARRPPRRGRAGAPTRVRCPLIPPVTARVAP